jgi:hypothetical protein
MRTYPHENAAELKAAGIDRIERPSGYAVTITREASPPNSGSPSDDCWVARDANGDWRNYCDLAFAGTAAKAVSAMFHADEVHSIEERGETSAAWILN